MRANVRHSMMWYILFFYTNKNNLHFNIYQIRAPITNVLLRFGLTDFFFFLIVLYNQFNIIFCEYIFMKYSMYLLIIKHTFELLTLYKRHTIYGMWESFLNNDYDAVNCNQYIGTKILQFFSRKKK